MELVPLRDSANESAMQDLNQARFYGTYMVPEATFTELVSTWEPCP